MNDITDWVNRSQMNPNWPVFGSDNSTSINTTKLFAVKKPVVIEPDAGVFSEFNFFVFVEEEDQSIKGIYWQASPQDKIKGYLKDMKSGKIQYLENGVLVKTIEHPVEEDTKMEKLMSSFRKKYAEFHWQFKVYA
ncbi:MAG TPA: hypothetical protein DHV24_00575, partial [Candidatus Margulisbacteria bacterium]|nr:hypothetical protein [Candidatus Margulisiibacteriota bacterium]